MEMPLQNRVTPFGDIVAVPERGIFTGNRGIIHDPGTRQLLARRWTTKTWIICLCAFKGRWREVMGRRSWTELFFLDEATALAAGHRPCFECRRTDARAFQAAWARGHGEPLPNAARMDAQLHAERLVGRAKRRHPLPVPLAALPDGTFVAVDDASYLMVGGKPLLWSPAGYAGISAPALEDAWLLTPPSTVRALAAGYRAVLHPTAASAPSNGPQEAFLRSGT